MKVQHSHNLICVCSHVFYLVLKSVHRGFAQTAFFLVFLLHHTHFCSVTLFLLFLCCEDLAKGVTTRGERVQDIIQGCITSLEKHSELWSQKKPVPLRKKEPSASSAEMYTSSDPAQFVLKSLDDTEAGGMSCWLNMKLTALFLFFYNAFCFYPQRGRQLMKKIVWRRQKRHSFY